MTRLRPTPEPPPSLRVPPMKKYNWEAIAMAARLAAGTDEPWVTVGHDVLRAHAWQINQGEKRALRPKGHYKAVSRGSGDYGTVQVCYVGPRKKSDSPQALRDLIDNSDHMPPSVEQ